MKKTVRSVAAAANEAKILKLKNIQMPSKDSIVEFTNHLVSLVNELLGAGHTVTEAEKRCALLRRIHTDFAVISGVTRICDKNFTESVPH